MQARLSDRQKQVVVLVAKGYTGREVAMELRLAYGTVRNYMKEIFDILRVRNRVELTLYFHAHPEQFKGDTDV